MELITTYPAAVNSKATVTMGVLDQATTIVEVLDATVLPEAPNLLVLGTDQTAETVLMTARENNTLTIQRAVQGIAKSWPAGTQIARNFTGKDWDDMRSNVEAIVTKILGLTASDVGALPLTGGLMSGTIDFAANGADFNTDSWFAIGMDSESIRLVARKNGKNRLLNFSNIADSLTDALKIWYYDDGNEHSARIFGEHNKPSGSYTGNGSATSRTIETGGIGNVAAVWSANGAVLLINVGGIAKSATNLYALSGSESNCANGKIILTTTSIFLNENGTKYVYQVL